MPPLSSLALAFLIYSSHVLGSQSALGSATLAACLSHLPYRVVLPSSPDYDLASRAYNRRLTFHPAAVVYPTSASEVSAAILCGASSGVPVVARSGGHSAAAYSLGGQDGSLVVDLSRLNGVTFEKKGEIVHVQTGNRLVDLARALKGVGRALPHGTCPSVGVGGHAAFGGFGFASREWGLLLDRMIGAEIVLSDGRVVNATLDENPDLFWAIRGSAPSFGIATSYTFVTLPEPPVTTAYSYVFAGNASSAAQCLFAFQEFATSSAPPPLGMQFSLISDLTYELFGSYTGPRKDFENIFLPLVRECEKTSDQDSGTHEFAQEMGWEAYLVSQAGTPPRIADCFYAKSLMTAENTPLSLRTIEAFTTYLYTEAHKHRLSWFVEVDLYGGVGSAINAVPKLDTAFKHRDRLLGFHMKASSRDQRPPYPEDGYAFINGMADALRSGSENATFGSYGSYVDPLLREEDWRRMYYGEEIYERLRMLKAKWDPSGVFAYPQMISTAVKEEQEGRRTVDEL
ncbi:Glucooligosaccharide oxidase [Calocera viscosa TUFC12733]|uniref:Glucooligosaccharide oxidase n=1 Tax=Calocera viscosa (strain TUFC12733) TaxID=1330018 RepID=A0A167G6B7_CALVF|nr:Glucooligosaccharide oxidase [Calocera viscosa TUFC12733]